MKHGMNVKFPILSYFIVRDFVYDNDILLKTSVYDSPQSLVSPVDTCEITKFGVEIPHFRPN